MIRSIFLSVFLAGLLEPRVALVSLQAKNASLLDVLSSLARQSDLTLATNLKGSSKISLQARDAKLEDVMDNICLAYSCTWEVVNSPRYILVIEK